MDCGPQVLPYPFPGFSASPFLALLTLDQGHNQTGAAHEQWHHHQQTQAHHQSLLVTPRTSELLTDPGHWSCCGVKTGTETLTLVRHWGKDPWTFLQEWGWGVGGQRIRVVTISSGGVSKRMSNTANPEEAWNICGIHPMGPAFCHTLTIFLNPHPYDRGLIVPILQISKLKA